MSTDIKTSPRYSIIIVSYNSSHEIGTCIKSIEKNTRDFEIIVIDNASKDNTLEILAQFPGIITIKNSDNKGFSRAVNQGLRIAKGRFIISLNPDTVVYPLWADRMADKMIRIKNVGAVGPLSTNCIGYQSIFNHLNIHPSQPIDKNEISERVLNNSGQYFENNILIGFCLMTSREVLNHIGFLDERLFLGNDDLDLSWRLKLNGYKLIVAKDAFIAHDMQKSFSTEPKAVTSKLVQESTDMLYRKLARYYGKQNVPDPGQLWGIDWYKPSENVLQETINGPEKRLNILLCYTYSEETLPARWEPVLRQRSHITTVGYSTDPRKKIDIPLEKKDSDAVIAIEKAGGFAKYDVLIWFESSMFSLSESLSHVPIPTIGIFSASSINFSMHEKALKLFDHAIFTEYNVYRYFREQGFENISHFYTNAFDETEIPPGTTKPVFDISFAGSFITYLYNERGKALMALLRLSDRYKVYVGNGVYGNDYKKLIANSKIVVNSLADGLRGITMRAYEAMGQGKLLLTSFPEDNCPIQDFQDGVHYVSYKDDKDLETKAEYYLSHPAESKAIGDAAREIILQKYTYALSAQRMEALLREVLSNIKPNKNRARLTSDDWVFVRLFSGDIEKAREVLVSGSPHSHKEEKECLLLYRTGNIDSALKYLKSKQGSLSKIGNYSLGVILQDRGEFAQAKRCLEESSTQQLESIEDLIWCLPPGMSYERLLNIRAGVLKYAGKSNEEVLLFADKSLSACAYYHLAYMATRENNSEYALKMLNEIKSDDCLNDKMLILKAYLLANNGDREGSLKALEKANEYFSLDVQNGIIMSGIYGKFNLKDMAISVLKNGIDSIQINNMLNIFTKEDNHDLLKEHVQMLKKLGICLSESDPEFDKGIKLVDGSWQARRFTSKMDHDVALNVNLNTTENPEALLKEKKGLGKPLTITFRNAQSLDFLEDLTLGKYDSFHPMAGETIHEYTFVTSENLLLRNGYEITNINRTMISGNKSKLIEEELVRAGRLVLKRLEYTDDEWQNFFTNAFTLIAAPRTKKDVKIHKVSIIILTYNQLEYTCKCIDSINKNTEMPFEIIIVDNGSKDKTPEWLVSEEKAGHITKVILNKENKGVAAGWNQGILEATGDYLLIMNNDIIVAKGWLENMVQCAESSPDIGMVGPMSNSVSGLQREARVTYTNMREFHSFAENYMKTNSGNWWELFRIAGFAMLIKAKALQKTGNFDERFGKGNFEDDDYCIRIRRAGYRILVAGDSFIHHFGGVSFAEGSVDWFDQMQKNQKIFNEKWTQIDKGIIESRRMNGMEGLLIEAEKLIEEKDFIGAIHKLMAIVEKEPKNYKAYNDLGLIAWYKGNLGDAEKFFEEALKINPGFEDSVFNLADLYALKGNNEKQVDCLEKFIALKPDNTEALNRLSTLKSLREEKISNGELHTNEFEENLVAETNTLISEAKYDEAIGLLTSLIEKDPDNSVAYNNMGLCAWYKGKINEAFWFFRKALALDPVYIDALYNFSDAAMVLGRIDEAKGVLSEALLKDPLLKDIRNYLAKLNIEEKGNESNLDFGKIISARELNIQGEKMINEGLFDKAESQFKEILKHDSSNFVAINNLGLVYWYRNDVASAYSLFLKALEICPVYEDGLVNIFDAALKLKKVPEIKPILEKAIDKNPLLRNATEILSQIKMRGDKIYDIDHYGQIDPSHKLNLEGRALLDDLKLNEATLKFLDSLDKNGKNSDAYCGLGIIQFYRAEYEDAFSLFSLAVSLNPLSQDALLNLYDAALKLGTTEMVRPYLENALEIDPGLSLLRKVLHEGLTPGELQ